MRVGLRKHCVLGVDVLKWMLLSKTNQNTRSKVLWLVLQRLRVAGQVSRVQRYGRNLTANKKMPSMHANMQLNTPKVTMVSTAVAAVLMPK